MTGKIPLRLLYLLPAEGFGGAERQGIYHLAELPHHDVKVTACVGPGDAVVHAMREAGLTHERFEYFPALVPGPASALEKALYGADWFRALIRSTAEIEHRVRRMKFDLIFANRTFAWLVAAQLSPILRIPYAIRAGSRAAHPLLPPALTLLDRVARPAAVFFNCRAVEREIAARFGCSAYRLPNVVDVERFHPASRGSSAAARQRLGLPLDVPLIGLAARPAPEKGFDLFASVVARVHEQRPDARFVVAGDFGWRARYEARFSAAGLGEAVQFLGRVHTMADFFHAVDIVVLTSRTRSIEASPNALLEAMATGRPIVATSVGGVPEIVRDGHEGYLVPDGDVSSFAARILELLRSPERRETFGISGRLRMISEHRIRPVVTELARNLRTVVATSATSESPREGALSCESTTLSVPRSIYSFARLLSRPSSSSRAAAI